MPLPFIAGALVGAAAVLAWNKKDNLKKFDADKFAKAAGSAVENSIKKAANLSGACGCKKTNENKKKC